MERPLSSFKKELHRYCVVLPGTDTVIAMLNPEMVRRYVSSEEQLDRIKQLHIDKWNLFHNIVNVEDISVIRRSAAELTSIEYELQDAWGLPRDARFHQPWSHPKCTCPKLDNEGRRGTGYTIIDGECPVHGTAKG